jgi:hypothetical protein
VAGVTDKQCVWKKTGRKMQAAFHYDQEREAGSPGNADLANYNLSCPENSEVTEPMTINPTPQCWIHSLGNKSTSNSEFLVFVCLFCLRITVSEGVENSTWAILRCNIMVER